MGNSVPDSSLAVLLRKYIQKQRAQADRESFTLFDSAFVQVLDVWLVFKESAKCQQVIVRLVLITVHGKSF